MQWLIIKSSSPDAETVKYALLGKQQQDGFSTSGWQQVKDLSRGKRIILLIPTEEVVLNTATIPTTNKKQLAKAIPFALEDSLVEDIDSLHFVHYRDADESDVNISAINSDRLNEWLDKLSEHGLTAHAVLPDVFALPVKPGSAALVIDQQRALFRKDVFAGFTTDQDLLSALLPTVLAEAELETLLLDVPDDTPLNLSDDLIENIGLQSVTNMHRQCDASLLQALPLSLLSGFTRKGQSGVLKNLLHWKNVAMLAIVIGGLWMANLGVENYKLKQHLDQLNHEISNVYAKTFPGKPVDNDYRVLHSTMAETLKALNVAPNPIANSPLELLAAITPKFKLHQDVTIAKVVYGDITGLDLNISAPSLSGLEKFRAAIDTGTIDAQVIASSSSASKSETTLKIKKVPQ